MEWRSYQYRGQASKKSKVCKDSLKFRLEINKKETYVKFISRVQFEQLHVQVEALKIVDVNIDLGQLVRTNIADEATYEAQE